MKEQPSTILVPLRNNRGRTIAHSVVDSEDSWVLRYSWSLTNNGYAYGMVAGRNMILHRLIMNTPKGRDTDHLNGDKLDNRKENLRVCSRSENNLNQVSARRGSKTGIRGVHPHGSGKGFCSYLKKDGKLVQQKWFRTKEEAAANVIKIREQNGAAAHSSRVRRPEPGAAGICG